jgi:hypothetical protein
VHADGLDAVLVVDIRGLPVLALGFITCPVSIALERIRVRSRRCRHESPESAWACGEPLRRASTSLTQSERLAETAHELRCVEDGRPDKAVTVHGALRL